MHSDVGETVAELRGRRVVVAQVRRDNGGGRVDGSVVALGALGIVTSMAIRGTTVVIPASIAWAAASKVAAEGGTRQGFIGVSSFPVPLPERQRAGRSQSFGLLITHVAATPVVTGILALATRRTSPPGRAPAR